MPRTRTPTTPWPRPQHAVSPSPLENAVATLIGAMHIPLSPICALRMRSAADRLEKEIYGTHERESATIAARIVKTYPWFGRAGIRFLTEKRSPANHQTMIDNLSNCRCPQSHMMTILHTPTFARDRQKGSEPDSGPPHLFVMDAVETVCTVLALALSEMTQGKYRIQRIDATPNTQPWPHSPEDLLPFGCDVSIEGLDIWAAKPGGWAISLLSTNLAAFHQPFAQAVLRTPNDRILLRRSMALITSSVEAYDQIPSSEVHIERRHLDSPIVYTMSYFHTLFGMALTEFNAFLRDNKADLAPVLGRALRIINAKPQRATWDDIRFFVTGYVLSESTFDFSQFRARYQGVEFNPLAVLDTAKRQGSLGNNIGTIAVARKGGCFNITCPAASDTVGHAQLCGKCKMVRFCGVECQRQAWKDDRLPHKGLCTKAFALKEQLGIRDWSQFGTLKDSRETKKIADLCKQKSVDIKALGEISRMLSDVMTARDAYLQKSGSTGSKN